MPNSWKTLQFPEISKSKLKNYFWKCVLTKQFLEASRWIHFGTILEEKAWLSHFFRKWSIEPSSFSSASMQISGKGKGGLLLRLAGDGRHANSTFNSLSLSLAFPKLINYAVSLDAKTTEEKVH